MMKIWINRIKSSIFTINSKNIIRKNRLFIILTLVFGMGLNGKVFGAGTKSKNQKPSAVTELEKEFENKIENKQVNADVSFIKNEPVNVDLLSNLLHERGKSLSNYLLENVFTDTKWPVYSYETENGFVNAAEVILSNISYAVQQEIESVKKEFKTLPEKDKKKLLVGMLETHSNNIRKATFNNFSLTILTDEILSAENLYDFTNGKRIQSLTFIRKTADLKFHDTYLGVRKDRLDSNFKNVFTSSRRLMQSAIIDDFVLKKYTLKSPIITAKKENIFDINNDIYRYDYKTIFNDKGNGINIGFKLDIISNNRVMESFFIKEFHWGRSSRNKKTSESESKRAGTNAQISSSTSFIISQNNNKKYENDDFLFNLKEPFIYDLLSNLSFGPKSTMIINPYISQGFYIATKDLSDGNDQFFTMKDIERRAMVDDVINKFGNFFLENKELEITFNELDIIGRMFRLKDLHRENFGLLLNINYSDKFDKIKISDRVKIIDFIYPNKEENYTFGDIDIVSFTRYENESLDLDSNTLVGKIVGQTSEEKDRVEILDLALQQFNARIENVQLSQQLNSLKLVLSQVQKGEEPDDKFDTKLRGILALQSQHIKNLMLQERGTEDKPEEIMLRHPMTGRPRTNAELIGFKLGRKPEDSDPNEKELSYLDNAFEDLDNYCQGIMCNYKALKKFITDGYNKYFDEQGNLKAQPVALAE